MTFCLGAVSIHCLVFLGNRSILKHYFYCIEQEELNDINFEHLKRTLVECLISKALDHKDHHRELTSVLISDLYGRVLSSDDVVDGFDDVLGKLSDLTIDTPDAATV